MHHGCVIFGGAPPEHRQFFGGQLSRGLLPFGDISMAMLLQLVLPLMVFFFSFTAFCFINKIPLY